MTAEPVAATPEDDGSIPLAGDTGIGSLRSGITTSAVIGDGPHGSGGSGSGDFDLYALDLRAGDQLMVDIDTPDAGEALDTIVVVFDAAGNFLTLNDDNIAAGELDSLLRFRSFLGGRHYVLIGAFDSFLADPFDSASGIGAGGEGPYDVTMTAGPADHDVYAVQLPRATCSAPR